MLFVPTKTGSYSLFRVQQVEAPQISDRTDVPSISLCENIIK